MAERMSAVASLLWIRTEEAGDSPTADPGYALITGFARTSAEVGAAMNLTSRAAKDVVGAAEVLDTRLPQIAALLAAGKVDWPTVALIISRTELVDWALMAQIDASLAERITGWQSWSRKRIINAVDAEVIAADPEAAKERRVNADTERHITITNQPNGMARIRGTLSAPAGAIVDKRLSQMATSVCRGDSRTIEQRRIDAFVALAEGRGLACDCGQPDCPTTPGDDPAESRFVINVIAGQDTLTGDPDQPGYEQPGYLEGYGVIDAEQVRELAETARLRQLTEPEVTDNQAARYQPTPALERWIRCRGLTCSFPGCAGCRRRPGSATDPPGVPTSTTPFPSTAPTPSPAGTPSGPTSTRSAENTTGSRPSTAEQTAGRPDSIPTAPWSGPHRPAAPTAWHPPVRTCSPSCGGAPARPPPHDDTAGCSTSGPPPKPPGTSSTTYARSTPKHAGPTTPAPRRSTNGNGATTCAAHCSSSKAATPAPAPGAPGSTTHSKTKPSPQTGDHHPAPNRHQTPNQTTTHHRSNAHAEGVPSNENPCRDWPYSGHQSR